MKIKSGGAWQGKVFPILISDIDNAESLDNVMRDIFDMLRKFLIISLVHICCISL